MPMQTSIFHPIFALLLTDFCQEHYCAAVIDASIRCNGDKYGIKNYLFFFCFPVLRLFIIDFLIIALLYVLRLQCYVNANNYI